LEKEKTREVEAPELGVKNKKLQDVKLDRKYGGKVVKSCETKGEGASRKKDTKENKPDQSEAQGQLGNEPILKAKCKHILQGTRRSQLNFHLSPQRFDI